MIAAVCPTSCLSAPNTVIRVCFSISILIPVGISNTTGNLVLADIRGAIANTSIHFEYEKGIAVGGNLFVDAGDAIVELYIEE